MQVDGTLSQLCSTDRLMLFRLHDFSEWGQCLVLKLLLRYKSADEEELFDILVSHTRVEKRNKCVCHVVGFVVIVECSGWSAEACELWGGAGDHLPLLPLDQWHARHPRRRLRQDQEWVSFYLLAPPALAVSHANTGKLPSRTRLSVRWDSHPTCAGRLLLVVSGYCTCEKVYLAFCMLPACGNY